MDRKYLRPNDHYPVPLKDDFWKILLQGGQITPPVNFYDDANEVRGRNLRNEVTDPLQRNRSLYSDAISQNTAFDATNIVGSQFANMVGSIYEERKHSNREDERQYREVGLENNGFCQSPHSKEPLKEGFWKSCLGTGELTPSCTFSNVPMEPHALSMESEVKKVLQQNKSLINDVVLKKVAFNATNVEGKQYDNLVSLSFDEEKLLQQEDEKERRRREKVVARRSK